MDQERPGKHLASGDVYRKQVECLIPRNPNLDHKDWKIPETRKTFAVPSRLRIAVFNDEGSLCQVQMFKSHGTESETFPPHMFMQEFSKAVSKLPPRSRCLYLLEGVNPRYVEAIGAHLTVDPAVFMRHQRTALWEGRQNGGNTARLASHEDVGTTFMMEYCELIYFDKDPESSSLRNPNDNRHINVSKQPHVKKGIKLADIQKVGIMHRKASFWSRRRPEATGDGWDGKIA